MPSNNYCRRHPLKGTDGVVILDGPPRLRFQRWLRSFSRCAAATPPVPGGEYVIQHFKHHSAHDIRNLDFEIAVV